MEEKREKRAALWSAALLLILAAALAAGLWLSGRTAGESSAPAAAPAPNPTAPPGETGQMDLLRQRWIVSAPRIASTATSLPPRRRRSSSTRRRLSCISSAYSMCR